MSVAFSFVPAPLEAGYEGPALASVFFDPATTPVFSSQLSDAGFSSIVVDTPAGLLGNLDIASALAARNLSLDIAVTHWAGVMQPVAAAGAIARLFARTGGRLSLRILGTGPGDPDLEGACNQGHTACWQRTSDYLVVLQRLWTNDRPIDHECLSFSIRGGFIAEKGPFALRIPIRIGGRSGTALQVAARHADIFELPAGTQEETRVLIARVRHAAERYGRADRIRFALPIALHPARENEDLGTCIAPPALDRLRSLIEAGVDEFMVHGPASPQLLRRFARGVSGQSWTDDSGLRRPGPTSMIGPYLSA